jgi:hypothetical protein
VGSENGKFLTPKVLAARPNLREWWVGEKIAATNDVGDDGIVDGSSAITKNNEDSSLLYREANSNSFLVMVSRHAREFFGSRKILRLWLMRISEKILAAGQTKILIQHFMRDPSHIFISNNLTNRELAP